ncbi:MAG TPA: diguanylate cyclase [Bryobacteraceae bacterium]|nr:diguanylate cyclase [Bryobacteraceae bacterium]
MKVLIADDNHMSRVLLRSSVERWGYEVVLAANGLEAWEILAKPDAPPMAILDWVMPDVTGPELCRRMRENHREPYTYILLLTSKSTKDDTVEGLESGADDYIVKPFDDNELRMRLRAGQRIVDLQIKLLQAREELRERANKDLLTMLPNRSAIATALEREVSRCHRDNRTCGIILLDIDHFKKINDTYGHFAGDAVLRETAMRLRGNMREYDQVGRYGGEEFLVVLPNCDLDQAATQAERMRHKLHTEVMKVDSAELTVSASFGVTISDCSERSPDLFVRVADEALYRSKARGRNCVSTLTLRESAITLPR